jgi:hypothetical protein
LLVRLREALAGVSAGDGVATAGETFIADRTVSLDITTCSSLKVNRRFGGTCPLHLKGRKISRGKSSVKSEKIKRNAARSEKISDKGHKR